MPDITILDELPEDPYLQPKGGPIGPVQQRDAMLDNPGFWVLVGENVSSATLRSWRQGKTRVFEEEGFEFQPWGSRTPAGASGQTKTIERVYGRYVGTKAAGL
jgi:hypothetical protein